MELPDNRKSPPNRDRRKMGQQTLPNEKTTIAELVNLKQAAEWATLYTNSDIATSNISYLVQYGRVNKYRNNGNTSDKNERA